MFEVPVTFNPKWEGGKCVCTFIRERLRWKAIAGEEQDLRANIIRSCWGVHALAVTVL